MDCTAQYWSSTVQWARLVLTPMCCDVHQVVLQCYSEMVEVALSQRLGRSLQQRPAQKGEELEDERAGTPTDMTDIDF